MDLPEKGINKRERVFDWRRTFYKPMKKWVMITVKWYQVKFLAIKKDSVASFPPPLS